MNDAIKAKVREIKVLQRRSDAIYKLFAGVPIPRDRQLELRRIDDTLHSTKYELVEMMLNE